MYGGAHTTAPMTMSTVLDSFPGSIDVICSNVAASSVLHVLARVFWNRDIAEQKERLEGAVLK